MAGSQAKHAKIKPPRGQAWPAETQTSEAANAGPAIRQLGSGRESQLVNENTATDAHR